MEISEAVSDIEPGKYVVAVSGGVDSVVLLHALVAGDSSSAACDFIVAHLNHGVRADATEDEQLVRDYAQKYRLPFEPKSAQLGPGVSEAEARTARYEFLESMRRKHNARAIITAHHQEDVLETAIINLIRGTKYRGLGALKSHSQLRRPLLEVPKSTIKAYATQHKLTWREDSTNQDLGYQRNYIRHKILASATNQEKKRLKKIISDSQALEHEIETLLNELGHKHVSHSAGETSIDRAWLILLPAAVRRELLVNVIRTHSQSSGLDNKQLRYIDMFVRTARHSRRHPINKKLEVSIDMQKVLVKAKTSA